MDILTIENLSFAYPQQKERALDGVSLSIREGDFVVLCGESGCGKTTLLRLIKRELAPHGKKQGRILYKGTPAELLDDRTAAQEIGYVMQNPENQIVTDKVWHELAFGLESLGVPTPVIQRRVSETASFFGIGGWFRKNTSELSGGEKQLLSLASVMLMQPKILLLDEPTAQLDPIAASEFIGTLQKLNRELGLTVLLAEHRMEDVFPAADSAIMMEKGRVLLYDTPRATGQKLKDLTGGRRLLQGLPSAVRIFNGLSVQASCPLTVREGRDFLSEHFRSDISKLEVPAYTHAKETAVELHNVWFRYERDLPDIMRGVNLSVYRGEIFSVLGPNGTGKTTLLRVVSRQSRPYRGRVMINGRKIREYRGSELYRHLLAFLPQNPQTVFLKPTVEQDFAEVCRAMGYTARESAAAIAETADELEIGGVLGKHPYDLSGGEQQKAALAKLLLLKPKIFLLDEPTKGIDAYAKAALAKLLRRLKEKGITVLMVTHDVEFAATASDRCAMYFDGEILSADVPSVFFSENTYYTTAANRIARHMFQNTVSCRDVILMCERNGAKHV